MKEFPTKFWKKTTLNDFLKRLRCTGSVECKSGSGWPRTVHTQISLFHKNSNIDERPLSPAAAAAVPADTWECQSRPSAASVVHSLQQGAHSSCSADPRSYELSSAAHPNTKQNTLQRCWPTPIHSLDLRPVIRGDGQLVTAIFVLWVDRWLIGHLWQVDGRRERDQKLVL